MKNQLPNTLLVVVCLFLAISCSKKSADPVPSLVGSWQQISSSEINCTDPMNDDSSICTTDCATYVFTATSVSITIPGAGAFSLTYTTSGNSITTNDGSSTDTGTFSIVGNVLTLSFPDDSNGCTDTITATRL